MSARGPDVLFVCTANRCRSPVAAALFDRWRRQSGAGGQVHSAGLGEPGAPPPPEVLDAALDYGVDLSAHRSRRLAAEGRRKRDLGRRAGAPARSRGRLAVGRSRVESCVHPARAGPPRAGGRSAPQASGARGVVGGPPPGSRAPRPARDLRARRCTRSNGRDLGRLPHLRCDHCRAHRAAGRSRVGSTSSALATPGVARVESRRFRRPLGASGCWAIECAAICRVRLVRGTRRRRVNPIGRSRISRELSRRRAWPMSRNGTAGTTWPVPTHRRDAPTLRSRHNARWLVTAWCPTLTDPPRCDNPRIAAGAATTAVRRQGPSRSWWRRRRASRPRGATAAWSRSAPAGAGGGRCPGRKPVRSPRPPGGERP